MSSYLTGFFWLVLLLCCFIAESTLQPDGTILVTALCLPFSTIRSLLPAQVNLTWFFAGSATLIYAYRELLYVAKTMPAPKRKVRRRVVKKRQRR